MTKADIDRIEALLAKATQGEWCECYSKDGSGDVAIITDGGDILAECFSAIRSYDEQSSEVDANAALIVALRNAAPALIAAARENERLREALVTAMIPIEAILLSGAEAAHCQDVRDALHDAVATARPALSTTNPETSNAE